MSSSSAPDDSPIRAPDPLAAPTPPAAGPGAAPTRNAVFACALGLVLYLSFEALAWIGLTAVAGLRGVRYEPIRTGLLPESRAVIERLVSQGFECRIPDRLLGWVPRPNGHCPLEQMNAFGLRATREFAPRRPPGITRIATFGDSFTYGSYVPNEATFQEVLMREHPELEVLNYGVAGYGLDQAFLRYRDGSGPFESDIVLIGFMSENIHRNVNSFRPFYNIYGPAMGKPRFALVDGRLRLLPNPLPEVDDYVNLLGHEEHELDRIGQTDFYYLNRIHEGRFDFLPSVRLFKLVFDKLHERLSPERILDGGVYNTASPAFQITAKLFDAFHRLVRERGATPVIAVFPNRRDLTQSDKQYQPLLDYLRAQGYATIDLMDAFAAAPQRDPERLFVHGHYSVEGNRRVAAAIAAWLERHALLRRTGEARDVRSRAHEASGEPGGASPSHAPS